MTEQFAAALIDDRTENRNKELKCSLSADRLSDHRFMANYFRLYLHSLEANLLVRVRHIAADPPTADPSGALPTEALAGRDRKRWFNRRREHDPLGEGHAEARRMRLIEVAAQIVVSTRRVLVRLSGLVAVLEPLPDRVCRSERSLCPPRSRHVVVLAPILNRLLQRTAYVGGKGAFCLTPHQPTPKPILQARNALDLASMKVK